MEKSKLIFYMEDGNIYEYHADNIVDSSFTFNKKLKENLKYNFMANFNYNSAGDDVEKQLFKLHKDYIEDNQINKIEFYILFPDSLDEDEQKDEKYTLIFDSAPFHMRPTYSRYTEGYNKIEKYFVESITVEFEEE